MTARCPTCEGTGFQIVPGPDGTTQARECDCRRADRDRRLLQAAGIPRRYDHCTLDRFEVHEERNPTHREALALARQWVERWPLVEQGLMLVGSPGTGKTHLAVGIARELVAKGARVRFHEQRELLKTLQGTYDADATLREADVLAPVAGAEVLILDDVGAGRVTDWARDVLHDIIAHRYNHELPLLLTSNRLTGDDAPDTESGRTAGTRLTLRDCLGDALMSRLYEMCRVIEFAGDDYRRGVLHARHRF